MSAVGGGAIDGKLAWGWLSAAVAVTGYTLYLLQMARRGAALERRIRPHPLSWLMFGFLTGTGWLIQVAQGASAGSWCLGVTALGCLVVSGASWLEFEWRFHPGDWAFVGGGAVLFLISCFIRRDPALAAASAVAATAADLAGYGPSVRKAWREPHSESIVNLLCQSGKCIPALLAVRTYTLATTVFLAMLAVANSVFAAVVAARRARLGKLGYNRAPLHTEKEIDR